MTTATGTGRPLDGRVALVTGGSSGLGRATAHALTDAGSAVAVLARSAADLDRTVAQIRAAGGTALAVAADLADADDLARAVASVRDQLGEIGILVNAAGTDVPGAVVELAVDDWDRVLDVNLRATFLLARAVMPGMARSGGGTIVNVGSVAGRRGWPNAAAYCAAKFGLVGLTQVLHAEGRADRIRACLLQPGAMDTNWGAWSAEDRGDSPRTAVPAEAVPPDHVAALITWIAAAPADLVLNEVTVTPLLEQGWP